MTEFEKLKKKYALEASAQELQRQIDQLHQQLPQLMAQQRQAQEAAFAADSGLRRFWDRVTGKTEADREALDRQTRNAQYALEEGRRMLRAAQENLAQLRQEQAQLGEEQALKAALSGQQLQQVRRLEAALCAEEALHCLGGVRKELALAQELARNPMMAPGDGHQENIHKASAGSLAEVCRQKLECIRECGMQIPIHPYFLNPMGYLVSAMRFGDQDRMNSAQQGIRETERMLKELLLQLAEET